MTELREAANTKIRSIIHDSINVKAQILQDSTIIDTIHAVVNVMVQAFKQGNKILFCGNGGSAADAQHLAAEFSGRFYKDRDPLPAEALHVNTSYLTAVANDYSYNEVYARMVKGSGKKDDVLVGLSTSGNSANMVAAFEQAKKGSLVTVGFTGSNGGAMKGYSDYLLPVPSTDTPRIQEVHILLGHIICQLVEEALF